MSANEQVYLATIEGAKYGMNDFPNGKPGLLFGVTFDHSSVACLSFQGREADDIISEAGVYDVSRLNSMECYVRCAPAGSSIVSFIRLAKRVDSTKLFLIEDETVRDALRKNAVRFWPVWDGWYEVDLKDLPTWRLKDGTILCNIDNSLRLLFDPASKPMYVIMPASDPALIDMELRNIQRLEQLLVHADKDRVAMIALLRDYKEYVSDHIGETVWDLRRRTFALIGEE